MARLFTSEDVEEKDEPSMVRLPASLWARLSRIANAELKRARVENPKARNISRNDVIKKVLRAFADQYEAEETSSPDKKRGH